MIALAVIGLCVAINGFCISLSWAILDSIDDKERD